MKQLFPKEIIENTSEVHHAKHNKKSRWIYFIITVGLLAGIVSLPFIKVKIAKTARGIIVPKQEHITVQCPYNGRIIQHRLLPNSYVHKGDTLLVINSQSLSDKKTQLDRDKADLVLYLTDLDGLVNNNFKEPRSAKYRQELLVYQEKISEAKIQLAKAQRTYETDKKLYEKNVIARVEYENSEVAYQVAQSNKKQLEKQQLATWQSQLTTYREQLRERNTLLSQLSENQELTVLTAPVSGTLLNVAGIDEGSVLSAGMQLATLSPDTELCVRTFVTPSDIGFLHNNDKVKLQIDAFDYNQWGLATGMITSIANDVQMVNNVPLFRVDCSLESPTLQLKNGFEGKLKKGMTLTARFELTERTLFQLLYDKVDDWLNPNIQEISSE